MRGFLKALAWVAGILGVITFALHYFVFDAWVVPDDFEPLSLSIQPTLAPGDTVLLSKSADDRSFGHLVRCTDPVVSSRFTVGRVYGLPRDRVTIDGERVSINGKRDPSPRGCIGTTMQNPANHLEERLKCTVEEVAGHDIEVYVSEGGPEGHKEATVEPDRAFLVSDNRHFHYDSRDYGGIFPDTCQHVVFRFWSARGFGDSAHRFNVIW